MRIAVVGKDNYKGLGVLTQEYREHLPIYKTLIYDNGDALHRFEDALYTKDPQKEVEWLYDCDVVFVLEIPWDTGFASLREQGVKTILKVNYEFLPETFSAEPNLYLCSSSKNYDEVKSENKVLLADPVDTDKISFVKREYAHTFVHHAGTIGVNGANGTHEFLNAIPQIKSDVKFIIRTQKKLPEVTDSRVTLDDTFYDNYYEMWGEGDVFVSPQKFRATSLPIQEAMANGMPVLSTNIKPFNEFVTWKVEPSKMFETRMARPLHIADIKPDKIAEAVDRVAGTFIRPQSNAAREYAESISWKKLQGKYIELCEQLLEQEK